mgnify:CR=1 FL=1
MCSVCSSSVGKKPKKNHRKEKNIIGKERKKERKKEPTKMTSVVADSAPFIKMLGETLASASGEIPTAKALEGKECVMFYFSAHWCP